MNIRKYAKEEILISDHCETDAGFLYWVASRLVNQKDDSEDHEWIQRLLKLAKAVENCEYCGRQVTLCHVYERDGR